jgi:hypothetical protein
MKDDAEPVGVRKAEELEELVRRLDRVRRDVHRHLGTDLREVVTDPKRLQVARRVKITGNVDVE